MAQPRIVEEPRNATVDVFRALGDPVRLELLAHIAAHGPICVCHLEEALAYRQSRISKHLAFCAGRGWSARGATGPGSTTRWNGRPWRSARSSWAP